MPALKREDLLEIIEDARLILLYLQLYMLGQTEIAAPLSSML